MNGFLSQNDKDITDENSSGLVKAFLNKLPIKYLYDCRLDGGNLAGGGGKIFGGWKGKGMGGVNARGSAGFGGVSEERGLGNFEVSGQRWLSPDELDQSELGAGLERGGWSKHKIPAELKRRWLPPDQMRKSCRVMANRQTRAVQSVKNFVDRRRENRGDFNSHSGIMQMP